MSVLYCRAPKLAPGLQRLGGEGTWRGSVHLHSAGDWFGRCWEEKRAMGIHSGSSRGSSLEGTLIAPAAGGASCNQCRQWAMPPPEEIRCKPFIWCLVMVGAEFSPAKGSLQSGMLCFLLAIFLAFSLVFQMIL